jgi:Flp pilus assembly protein TadD
MNRVMVKPTKFVSAILLLTLAILVPVVSATLPGLPNNEDNTSVAGQASQLARAGHTQEAIRLLQAALATRPTDLAARLALADIYARNGQADQAEHELREALRLHPESSLAEMALGAFYISAGSLKAAEPVLEDAVRRHPKLTQIRAQLALVLALEHKYAEAEANIRLVQPPIDSNPRILYFRLAASIDSGLGDLHAAAHATEEALRVMPGDEQLQLVASIAEGEAGEWQACMRNVAPLYASRPTPASGLVLLRAQLAMRGDFASTLRSLRSLQLPEDQTLPLRIHSAEILAAADEHGEAVEELQEALKIKGGPDDELLYNLAVEQYRSRQFDAAVATLAALRGQKDSGAIENLAGDIEEQEGDSFAAVHSYQNAIALAPQEQQYRLSLGAELLKYHTYEPAVLVFQQAAELFPESARVYVGLGMAYYLLDKYDDSVSAFLRADKLDRGSGRIINYLGATQLRRPGGPNPAAVDAICGRADSNSSDPAAVTWCATLLFQKAYLAGNQAGASEVIRRLRIATSLATEDPVANCSLGHALEWTEQLAEARPWLEICVALRPDSAEDHFRLSRVYQRLGLTQAAREQADLTLKSNVDEDRRDAVTIEFVYEMLGQPKHTKDPN